MTCMCLSWDTFVVYSRSIVFILHRMLAAITARVNTLDAQAIGNCLYSLQKMNSEPPEVRAFLDTFARRMEATQVILKPQELANAMWGLQGMNSDYPEVRAVVVALMTKLEASLAAAKKSPQGFLSFTAQGVGNAICGLQSMSDEVTEPVMLLGYFAGIIMNSPEMMTPQDIGNAMFGLQVRVLNVCIFIKMHQCHNVLIISYRDLLLTALKYVKSWLLWLFG